MNTVVLAESRPRSRKRVEQPLDTPLLTFESAASYLGMTVGALRKLIEGRADGPDSELGKVLRENVVKISDRRRFIRKEPFLQWLKKKASA